MRWLCIFFLFGTTYAEYSLSLCAIFKNEAPHLREWIEFHRIQGVEHFFLYNNQSEDAFAEVLQPYLEQNVATLIDWPFSQMARNGHEWVKIQKAAYMDAIQQYGETSQWMGFLDIDEFLFCPSGESLPSFLSRYEEFGGVGVNWLMFGTSALEEIPQGSSMIEALTRCSLPSHSLSYRVKMIVQPKCVTRCCHAHSFLYKEPFFAVNCNRMVIEPKALNSPSISHDQIRINHYWTRTEKYFREEKIESRKMRRESETEEALRKRAAAYNLASDFAIQRFVPELKNRLR